MALTDKVGALATLKAVTVSAWGQEGMVTPGQRAWGPHGGAERAGGLLCSPLHQPASRRWQNTERSPRGGLSPFLPWVVFSVGRLVFLTQNPSSSAPLEGTRSPVWSVHDGVLGASKGGGCLKAAPCK